MTSVGAGADSKSVERGRIVESSEAILNGLASYFSDDYFV